jgi:hypothetical protein
MGGCLGAAAWASPGRRNYQLCSVGIAVDSIAHPELFEQLGDAAFASAWCVARGQPWQCNVNPHAGRLFAASRAVRRAKTGARHPGMKKPREWLPRGFWFPATE